MRVMQKHMPCLTDIRCDSSAPAGVHAETSLSTTTPSRYVRTGACRLTSYKVLQGLDWLDLQQLAAQLTCLSLKYSYTLPAANADRQGNAQMLAALAQFSELRHLDVGECNFVPTDGALCLLLPSSIVSLLLQCHKSKHFFGLRTDDMGHKGVHMWIAEPPLFAGSAACSQLSTLCKLTSLVAGAQATHCLRAILPALRALKRLKCIVNSFHTDSSGALPVLSELTALQEIHIEGRLAGDYKLVFPPSLQVPTCSWTIDAMTCMYVLSCTRGYCRSVLHANRCLQLLDECSLW